ncbi:FecR family protein [Pedobacter miscanthi]|nr:FecR family protein [Pedobacter miscanthi]
MNHKRAEDLLKRAGSGKLEKDEEATLDTWYINTAENQPDILTDDIEKRLDRVWKKLPVNHALRIRRIKIYSSISVAAAMVIAVLIFYSPGQNKKDPDIIAYAGKYKNDVLPGSNRAVLIKSDGSEVNLDQTKGGLKDGKGTIISVSKGVLTYHDPGSPTEIEVFNTIKIPFGGEYQLTLADGTQVWLNSGSTLRYPVSFVGKERNVELTGEAYFQVAKDAKRPFKVRSKDQEIEVLGTHFNISAYPDEVSSTTSLLEGSVKVVSKGKHAILNPGQQSMVRNGGISVADADVERSIAWKNGEFNFKNTDIESIMRVVSRWYDLKVDYVGGISKDSYSGRISKKVTLTKVLKILELSGTHFEIDGKTIKVID